MFCLKQIIIFKLFFVSCFWCFRCFIWVFLVLWVFRVRIRVFYIISRYFRLYNRFGNISNYENCFIFSCFLSLCFVCFDRAGIFTLFKSTKWTSNLFKLIQNLTMLTGFISMNWNCVFCCLLCVLYCIWNDLCLCVCLCFIWVNIMWLFIGGLYLKGLVLLSFSILYRFFLHILLSFL